MKNQWIETIFYIIAGEESRPGRSNYWNDVFLAGRSPVGRRCLETVKICFCISLSIAVWMAIGTF